MLLGDAVPVSINHDSVHPRLNDGKYNNYNKFLPKEDIKGHATCSDAV